MSQGDHLALTSWGLQVKVWQQGGFLAAFCFLWVFFNVRVLPLGKHVDCCFPQHLRSGRKLATSMAVSVGCRYWEVE